MGFKLQISGLGSNRFAICGISTTASHFFVYVYLNVQSLTPEGFKEAAEKFQEESGLSTEVDLKTMDNRIQIRDSIQSGNIQDATSLVHQLHPELLDDDRYLFFHLQVGG